MHVFRMLAGAVFLLSGVSMANETIINQYIENPKEVGSIKFEYIFWDVYFARLTAPSWQYDQAQPYVLSLTYLRDFEGKSIVERAIKEMKSQGFKDKSTLDLWLETMLEIFPDVKKGQTITGIATEAGEAIFYLDESLIGKVENSEFTQKFFDIWLSDKTSEPKMRSKLLNL